MSVYTIVNETTTYDLTVSGATEITLEVQDETEIAIIQVGTQGPIGPIGADGADGIAGPPIVNTSSYTSPTTISGAIAVPTDQRSQLFIKGNSALTTVTSIGGGTGTQELYLVGTDDAAKVELPKSALSNVQLSGVWYAGAGSMIKLHWIAGLNKWLETFRNEI